jgi:hypothetical protein
LSKSILDIGPCPTGEESASVGDVNYIDRATRECGAFARQIIRQLGPLPDGVTLYAQTSEHELGSYLEMVAGYNEERRFHVEFIRKVEQGTPVSWDDEAKAELGLQ